MTNRKNELKEKITSMFRTEGFELTSEALSNILDSADPLQMATKALEKAKASSPRPFIITSGFLKDVEITVPKFSPNMTEEEIAKIMMIRLQSGELLHFIFRELQNVFRRDSFYVKNLLEHLWRKGLLPLHDYEAHYYVKFLMDKNLQEKYR